MTTRLDILTRIDCGWTWVDTNTSRRLTDSVQLSFRRDSLSPTASRDVDIAWYLGSQTLGEDLSVTYDLTSLVQSLFGHEVTFTLGAVKFLYLYNRSSSGLLNISSGDVTPWIGPFGLSGDALNVESGTPLCLANFGDGWSVDSTAKNIQLTASGGDMLFDIAILGTSPGWNASSSDSTSGGTPSTDAASSDATSSVDGGGTTSSSEDGGTNSGEAISSLV